MRLDHGATQGLGLVLTCHLAAARWQLILTSRREAAVTAVSHELAACTRTIPFVNAGHCSRHRFAQAILCEMVLLQVAITPILRTVYKRPSTPPAWNILHNTAGKAVGIELPPWQDALAAYLKNER